MLLLLLLATLTLHGTNVGLPAAWRQRRLTATAHVARSSAGSRARSPVHITGADAVAVSYPRFFEELERISRA